MAKCLGKRRLSCNTMDLNKFPDGQRVLFFFFFLVKTKEIEENIGDHFWSDSCAKNVLSVKTIKRIQ